MQCTLIQVIIPFLRGYSYVFSHTYPPVPSIHSSQSHLNNLTCKHAILCHFPTLRPSLYTLMKMSKFSFECGKSFWVALLLFQAPLKLFPYIQQQYVYFNFLEETYCFLAQDIFLGWVFCQAHYQPMLLPSQMCHFDCRHTFVHPSFGLSLTLKDFLDTFQFQIICF